MKSIINAFSVAFIWCMLACNNSPSASNNETSHLANTISKKGNNLSFKMDGVLWQADNNLFAAFHPKGYNKAVLIAGSKGAKNKDEQAFTLNLYNIDKEGEYTIQTNDPNHSVVQLGNLNKEEYLCGSMMGYNLKVSLKKCADNPTIIEASFEGEIISNTQRKIKITEGTFYYQD